METQNLNLDELVRQVAVAVNKKCLSYPIGEWCELRHVSRSQFYELAKQGLAPATYKVGRRRYISADADRAWQTACETQSFAA